MYSLGKPTYITFLTRIGAFLGTAFRGGIHFFDHIGALKQCAYRMYYIDAHRCIPGYRRILN